jgi:hypothetical protein
MLTTVGLGLMALVIALIVTLVVTVVWSSDAGRRGRAREMLVLLLTHASLIDGSRSSSPASANLSPPWVEHDEARRGITSPVAAGASDSQAGRP